MSNYVSAEGHLVLSREGMDDYEEVRKTLRGYNVQIDQTGNRSNEFEIYREGSTSSSYYEMYKAFNNLGGLVSSGHIDLKSEYGDDWCLEKSVGDENFVQGFNIRRNREVIDVDWRDNQEHTYEKAKVVEYPKEYDFIYRDNLRWEYDCSTHYSPYYKPQMPLPSIRIQMAKEGILPNEYIDKNEMQTAAEAYAWRTSEIREKDPQKMLRTEYSGLQDKALSNYEKWNFEGRDFKAEEWLTDEEELKMHVIENLFDNRLEDAFKGLIEMKAFDYDQMKDFEALDVFLSGSFKENPDEYVISDVLSQIEESTVKGGPLKELADNAVLFMESSVIAKEKQLGIIPQQYAEIMDKQREEGKEIQKPAREEPEWQKDEGVL